MASLIIAYSLFNPRRWIFDREVEDYFGQNLQRKPTGRPRTRLQSEQNRGGSHTRQVPLANLGCNFANAPDPSLAFVHELAYVLRTHACGGHYNFKRNFDLSLVFGE
jgi:hypothetical protein